ncbi:uncharacterized protein A4U43_C08F33870 [Asparagus officinalis]|nr:uncharacterized protein A4U43_C08F33870 [Asparagus officinalis]
MAGFPLMQCRARVSDEGEGYMDTESSNASENVVDWSVEGFGVERLEGLMGEKAAEYTRELEDLYGKMMGKLEGLVRLVEASSVKVHEQTEALKDENIFMG